MGWRNPTWEAKAALEVRSHLVEPSGPVVATLSFRDGRGDWDYQHLTVPEIRALVDGLVLAWPDRERRPLAVKRLVLALGHAEEAGEPVGREETLA